MPDSDTDVPQPNGRDHHEQRIRDLAHMQTDSLHDLESVLDNADAAYALAHEAGLMRDADGNIEPFVWPSVRREQLYQEELRRSRPTCIAGDTLYDFNWGLHDNANYRREHAEQAAQFHGLYDPRIALAGYAGPIAIQETVNDNDAVMGSSTIKWLASDSYEDAVAYCERVGWAHEQPGPGEYDGIYTIRAIYDNPHFLDRQNAHLGEVDHQAVVAAFDAVIAAVGLTPEEAALEFAYMKSLVYSVETWNRAASTEMLSDDEGVSLHVRRQKACAYLNHSAREEQFRLARDTMERQIQVAILQIAASMNGYTLPPTTPEQLGAVGEATSTIAEALQTRFELREATQKTIEIILKSFLNLARMKAYGVAIFNSLGSGREEQQWLTEINNVIDFTVGEIDTAYAQRLRNYITAENRI